MQSPEKQKPAVCETDGLKKDIEQADDTAAAAKSKRGRQSRRKGARIECEIVNLHRRLGIHAEKVPLSGAAHYRGAGHDVDIFPFGKDGIPLLCEVKARASGGGFKTLESWLADNDVLFLRRDNSDPLILLPARVWFMLLDRVRR